MSDQKAPAPAESGTIKPFTRFVFIAVSAVFYLGLAILSWGGFDAFFSHSAFVALTVVSVMLFGAAYFAGGNVSPGVREDRGNRWVLKVFGVIGLVLACLPPYLDRKGWWVIDGDTTRWLGLALYTMGGYLRLWPVYVLGHRFSGLVAIQPGHTLVTTGLYRFIRHPSYLGLLLNSLGWALVFRSGAGVVLTVLTLVPLLARIRSEERLLRSQFGEEYAAFCARTSWRLVPGIY